MKWKIWQSLLQKALIYAIILYKINYKKGKNMSDIKITECRCCGNRDHSRFVKTAEGYLCKCCSVGFRYETEGEKIGCMMGYRQLKNYHFDEAREAFVDVLYDYPESIDARWGLLLARWGIVFVKGFFDDNMSIEDMKKAVELCTGKAETECSGNVTKENVAKLTQIGVDYISSGALTHSSPILDLSLKNLHAV